MVSSPSQKPCRAQANGLQVKEQQLETRVKAHLLQLTHEDPVHEMMRVDDLEKLDHHVQELRRNCNMRSARHYLKRAKLYGDGMPMAGASLMQASLHGRKLLEPPVDDTELSDSELAELDDDIDFSEEL